LVIGAVKDAVHPSLSWKFVKEPVSVTFGVVAATVAGVEMKLNVPENELTPALLPSFVPV
jgi:hypothetical protein